MFICTMYKISAFLGTVLVGLWALKWVWVHSDNKNAINEKLRNW